MEENKMADFNKNELILDRVRSLVTHDIATGKLLFRLTSLEEPSLPKVKYLISSISILHP